MIALRQCHSLINKCFVCGLILFFFFHSPRQQVFFLRQEVILQLKLTRLSFSLLFSLAAAAAVSAIQFLHWLSLQTSQVTLRYAFDTRCQRSANIWIYESNLLCASKRSDPNTTYAQEHIAVTGAFHVSTQWQHKYTYPFQKWVL